MPKTIQNLNLPSQMESSRCVLKQHTLDKKYIQLWVDKINENLEWLGAFLPYFEKCRTYQEQYEYFKMLLKGDKEINYAIFDKATHELIGSVGIFNLDTQGKKTSLEISIMFFKKYAGQGYGQDIFNILEQNLTTKGITYIILKIHKDNIRSQKLAIRTGYVLDKSIFSNDSEFILYKKKIHI